MPQHGGKQSSLPKEQQANRKNSLEAALERRILPLLARYQAQLPTSSVGRAVRTDTDAIISFITKNDSSLARKQHRILKKAVESCLITVRQRQDAGSTNEEVADDASVLYGFRWQHLNLAVWNSYISAS